MAGKSPRGLGRALAPGIMNPVPGIHIMESWIQYCHGLLYISYRRQDNRKIIRFTYNNRKCKSRQVTIRLFVNGDLLKLSCVGFELATNLLLKQKGNTRNTSSLNY